MKQILDIESKNALVKYRLERASETVLCTKEDVAALTDQAYSFIEYIKSLVDEE